MQMFVFWSRGDSVNIYPKSACSDADKTALKDSGFKRIAFETKAENEEQALEAYLTHFNTNTVELREFSRTHLFLILIGLTLFLALWLARSVG